MALTSFSTILSAKELERLKGASGLSKIELRVKLAGLLLPVIVSELELCLFKRVLATGNEPPIEVLQIFRPCVEFVSVVEKLCVWRSNGRALAEYAEHELVRETGKRTKSLSKLVVV